jgi:isopenicillin N synthase-like dioxygenase
VVSPGDIMQFLTGGTVESTPHKAQPGEHIMTYFHEPTFDLGLRPLVETEEPGYVHYGTHFTTIVMQTWPDRITTQRIQAEDRLAVLAGLSRRASVGA